MAELIKHIVTSGELFQQGENENMRKRPGGVRGFNYLHRLIKNTTHGRQLSGYMRRE